MMSLKLVIYKRFPRIYEFLSGNSIYCYAFFNLPTNSYLHKSHKISNSKFISIGDGVTLEKDVWMNAIKDGNRHGFIQIKNGSKIGQRCTLSSVNSIKIEKNVLLGLNIYIADHEHEYRNVKQPIMHQGTIGNGVVVIKQNAWIGNNVVILGGKGIVIGENSVIGANSVVKSNIPDFAVAVGNPAKVVKKFSFSKKRWINV